MKKHAGISLLEILLVLAIIATITVMSTRYFTITKRQLHVTQTINQIKEITQASYQWLNGQRRENFAASNDLAAISLPALISAGLISNPYTKKQKTVWNTAVTIEPATDPSYVKITLSGIHKAACNNLAHQLAHISQNPPSCTTVSKPRTLFTFNGDF